MTSKSSSDKPVGVVGAGNFGTVIANILARHRRVHLHFTPKGASWMNLVESWFSILTRQQVRRGSFASGPELIAAIERFVAAYNERAQPFAWTKPAGEVLAKAVKPIATSGVEH